MTLWNPDVEAAVRTLFRRCVQCPQGVAPSCPSCPDGQTCSMKAESCTQCASTTCVDADDSSGPSAASAAISASSKGRNIGAIAGGVIGGIVFVAVATWLVWRFCIKHRRQRYEDEQDDDEWVEGADGPEKVDPAGAPPRDDRASMHTVRSAASSVFTRASNVIPIAYIPGVTNRSPPSTPGLLVPPVPPLPYHASTATSPATTPAHHQDQHFFMPELRDSTCSAFSDGTVNRESLAPSFGRSSVATTIYRNNAVVNPVPAQTVIRGKAAVVSVKSSSQNSPNESRTPTPPMPAIDFERFGQRGLNAVPPTTTPEAMDDRRRPSSPAFSVGSTFLSGAASAARAATARPVSVRQPSKSSIARQNRSRGGSAGNDEHVAASIVAATSTAAKTDLRASALTSSTSAASKHSRARGPDMVAAQGDPEISDDEDDEPGARARKSMVGQQHRESARTVIEETPIMHRSPFSDTQAISSPSSTAPVSPQPSAGSLASPTSTANSESSSDPVLVDTAGVGASSAVGHQHSGSLSAVIEEAARRACRQPTHGLGSNNRDPSPFSDANAVRTP